MMEVHFFGGPYDGIRLDANDINLFADITPIGHHLFFIMPPYQHWESVRRGDLQKNGPFGENEISPVYLRIRHPNGDLECKFDEGGNWLNAAFNDNLETGTTVQEAPHTRQNFKCYRGDLREIEITSEHFSVTDEKDREWKCIRISNEEGEGNGFPEAFSHMGRPPSDKPISIVILLCDHKDDLRCKLSDLID